MKIEEELFAQAMGEIALQYLKQEEILENLLQKMESEALQTLREIKTVLDDSSIEDPECFLRVDALVETFHAHGLKTTRHDWG
jgi:hypothetical protein